MPGFFAEGRECVYYGDDDLEERLEYFLEHEDERRALAEAARAKVASYTFSALLMKGIEELWEMDREGLLERARRRVSGRFERGPEGGPAEVHVRHRWPPKLEPPAQGRWVFMQPWEFGRLPKSWLPALRRVDEVWAYSRSVRDCYLEAGVPADRVHVIPLGADPGVFRPDARPLSLPAGPGFRFLFVGGTIYRKGFDLLMKAYTRAFRPSDGVGLVIKDMGTKSFYQGQTAAATVTEHRARGYPIEYHDRALNDQEMAGLYAACDCLAHPYRGEGFALPVVEAMACGLPAIVTGAGPALDYASEATAFLVPAQSGRASRETGGRHRDHRPALDVGAECRCAHRAAPNGGLQHVGNPRQGSRRVDVDPRSLHLVPFGGRDRSPVTGADGKITDQSYILNHEKHGKHGIITDHTFLRLLI